MLSPYLDERINFKGPDECWTWKLSTGSHGYGNAWNGKTVVLAHRLVLEAVNGPIPTNMTIDHICRNRICCNPKHLQLRTNLENATDNGQRDKTHCPQGHPYSGDNLYVSPQGHRRCLFCKTLRR